MADKDMNFKVNLLPEDEENLGSNQKLWEKFYGNKIILGTSSYGDELPMEGEEGQIFYQISDTDGAGTVPAGGTQGQVIIKNSAADYDASWQTPSGTWNIDISGSSASCTGNAATATMATKLGDTTIGGPNQSFYLNDGIPTEGNSFVPTTGGTFSESVNFNKGLKTGEQASAGSGSGVVITNDGGIEIFHNSTPFIDFHYQASIADYSVRLECNGADSLSCTGKLYGAVWNDYAEYRQADVTEPGRCIIENGDDTLSLSTKRLQLGASIISDTFGFAIGETDECKTPIAVSGRVLAYPYESRDEFRKNIGRPVCSGPNGTVSIMTDEEYCKQGYKAIGTISAVPDYEEWGTGKVKVDGRIWIKIK